MRYSLDMLHEEVMECERMKEEISEAISKEEDETMLDLLGETLWRIIRRGLAALKEIDETASNN